MSLLKRIKQYVVSDNEMKGQEIGSIGDIDDQYGLDSLTLDSTYSAKLGRLKRDANTNCSEIAIQAIR